MHIIGTVLPEMVATQTHPRYLLIENVAGFEVSQNIIATAALQVPS